MGKRTIVAMPGDGIGKVVLEETIRVLEAAGFEAEYVNGDIGWEFWCNEGNPLPERTINLLKEHKIGLFGAITSKPKDEAFDELAAKNKFNVPNSKELSLRNDDIDREMEPLIRKWDKIKDFWEDLIWDLSFWSLSYCSFAPYLQPWAGAKNPKQACIDTQKMRPGIFKEREKLFQKYFGISFNDLFKHETFIWDVNTHYMVNSQEYIEFLALEVYPHCKPFTDLPKELITKREWFNENGPNKISRETNPEYHLVNRRLQTFYDSVFGEGRYASKFDITEPFKTAAAPWNLDTFKLK